MTEHTRLGANTRAAHVARQQMHAQFKGAMDSMDDDLGDDARRHDADTYSSHEYGADPGATLVESDFTAHPVGVTPPPARRSAQKYQMNTTPRAQPQLPCPPPPTSRSLTPSANTPPRPRRRNAATTATESRADGAQYDRTSRGRHAEQAEDHRAHQRGGESEICPA